MFVIELKYSDLMAPSARRAARRHRNSQPSRSMLAAQVGSENLAKPDIAAAIQEITMTKKALVPANPNPTPPPKPQSVVTTSPQKPTPQTAAVTQTGEREITASIDRACSAEVSGSSSSDFGLTLIRETMGTISMPFEAADTDRASCTVNAAIAALAAFKATDEIEGMLAAQAVALHHAAMECLRRAIVGGQHPDATSKLRRDGANMARSMTDMLEALDRKRGKGPQVVRVERVVVHEGGQAIVGNVQPAAQIGAENLRKPEIATAIQAPVPHPAMRDQGEG